MEKVANRLLRGLLYIASLGFLSWEAQGQETHEPASAKQPLSTGVIRCNAKRSPESASDARLTLIPTVTYVTFMILKGRISASAEARSLDRLSGQLEAIGSDRLPGSESARWEIVRNWPMSREAESHVLSIAGSTWRRGKR